MQSFEPHPPGEILAEEFMKPLGISQNWLSRDVDIPVSRVSDIVRGGRAITADTALRLGEYFGTSAEYVDAAAGRLRSPRCTRRQVA